MPKLLDLSGQSFGALKVIAFVRRDYNYNKLWRCLCKCGRETLVDGGNLRSGHSKSCGCLKRELLRQARSKHGKVATGITSRYAHKRLNGKSGNAHRQIAEQVLGKPLPTRCPVHHHNRNGFDNTNSNLVICENHSYHMLLHQRTRVRDAGFDPNFFKWCQSCGIHKPKEEFPKANCRTDGLDGRCRQCNREKSIRQYWAKKGAA